VAAGATIVLVAAGLFAVSLLAAPRHGLLARWRARRPAATGSDRAAVAAPGTG
jgi:manganese/iron transport system permease protein